MNGDIKIGKLLCDEDIITKRQLNKALQRQVKGDKRTLGEILVDLGFCDFDDITSALLNNDSDTKKHEEKQQEIVPKVKDIPTVEPEPVVEESKKDEPIEISEEKVMNTKFTMSLQTLGALVAVVASGIGGYYMLLQEIQEAKELPEPVIDRTEYDLKDELIRQTIMDTQEDVEDIKDQLDKIDERLYELQKKN